MKTAGVVSVGSAMGSVDSAEAQEEVPSGATVYVGSEDENLYALDAETGDERWSFQARGSFNSSPTVVDGTVYIGVRTDDVYALDAETGEEKWQFRTNDNVRSSPTVVDGTVYIGSEDNNVYALGAETGEEKWRFETGNLVSSSPTVVAYPANGDSIGSRVLLGTLGHHDEWAERANEGVDSLGVDWGTKDVTDDTAGDEHHRFTPETSVREILDTLEKHGKVRVKTTTLSDELDYTRQGIKKRLRGLDEYVEEEHSGQGSSSLWTLKYDRRDFLKAFDELGDLTPTEEIAEHVGCSEEVTREWLYKLKDENEVDSHTRGEDLSLLWSKVPD